MLDVSDPRLLLSPDRLDFAIKHRFFRHLSEGGDADAERVYRWHIQKRTGGVELRSWKASLDDYVRGCVSLLGSMKARGFDPDYPIRIGSNGALMDGAHRASCAMYLKAPVSISMVNRPGIARPWGRDALIEHGIDREDLFRVMADFEALWATQSS